MANLFQLLSNGLGNVKNRISNLGGAQGLTPYERLFGQQAPSTDDIELNELTKGVDTSSPYYKGKVCIYVFVPSEKRETYNAEDYTPEEIDGFAKISSIADTWFDEEQYSLAIQRLDEVRQAQKPKDHSSDISFVINDDITYRQLSDFKVRENVIRYQQLTTLRNRQANLNQSLEKIRDLYAAANREGRKAMKDDILSNEQEILTLHRETHNLEKTIRNTENTFLTKNK